MGNRLKYRMVWNDFKRNKTVTLTTLLFVTVAAMLLSLAAVLTVNLSGSIDRLMQDAKTPHFMQMHTGEPEEEKLQAFADNYDGVSQYQTMKFLNIDSSQIIVSGSALTGTLQDNGFCTQSEKFDFLLDLDNKIVQPEDGQLYAPVFYSRDGAIALGDVITIEGTTFTVAGFVRDSQMNSALASSKRFVVSEGDYKRLESFGAVEYLIEFRLENPADSGEFTTAYSAAGLPANGPALTWPLFRMMSAISDGMMIAVILLMSFLVILIAFLCIRFTLLAKIENDYREIGTMKALGMRVSEIQGLYLFTYGALAAAGGLLGFLLSLVLYRPMAAGIRQNLGSGGRSSLAMLMGLAGILFMFCLILFYVNSNLRSFRKISAAEALRFGISGQTKGRIRLIPLSKCDALPVNAFLGIQDVFTRKRLYGTMLAVVILASFIMIVPQNLYHTISDKDFITYMGVGRCDLRMDIQQNENIDQKAAEAAAYMEADTGISQYALLTTKTFGVTLDDNSRENIKIELGDHSVFPLRYVSGRAPLSDNEFALSSLIGDEWGLNVGDQLSIQTSDKNKMMTVCGIYSDITNGGKTAKAIFSDDKTPTAWATICARLTNGQEIDSTKAEYESIFTYAKVSGIDDYVAQTFGQTLRSVGVASLVCIVVAAAVTLLVTLLFLKLLVAKDRYSIAVMKAMGFTGTDIKKQYLWRIVSVLAIGILLGTILAGTLGEKLAAAAISSFGAAAFRFTVNLPATYLFCPLIMIAAALLAMAAGTAEIGDVCISESIKE